MSNKLYNISHHNNTLMTMPKAHFHDYYEILIALSEGCNFFINHEAYSLKKGSLVFIGGGNLHHGFAVQGSYYERYVLHFTAETLKRFSTPQTDFYAEFAARNCCVELDNAQTERVICLFENCMNHGGENFGDDIRQNIYFQKILLNFYDLFHKEKYIVPEKTADFEKAAPIIGYIAKHLVESLSLDHLAAEFSLNKYYLCHMFKESVGFSIIEYINNCRVLYARKLLHQGMTVQEAAEASGFSNSAHFIRTFSKLNGITPGQYAKAYKNKVNPLSRIPSW